MSFQKKLSLRSRKADFAANSQVKLGKNGKAKNWKTYLTGRFALALVLFSCLMIIVAVTGAQVIKSIGGTRSKADEQNTTDKSASRKLPNVDIRVTAKENLAQIGEINSLAKNGGSTAVKKRLDGYKKDITAGLTLLKADNPTANVKMSPLTGAVEVLNSATSLTGMNPGRSGEDIVREFINGNRQLYGLQSSEINNLHFIGESNSAESGLRMVRIEQTVNDRPVFQSESRFILDKDGRIIESLGLFVPQSDTTAAALDNLLSAQEALKLTAAQLNIAADENQMTVSDGSDLAKTEILAGNDQITDVVTSKIVYFPVTPGVLIPAWAQVIFTPKADFYVLVDARNGTLLWRKNIRASASSQEARFRVYVQADGKTPADSPAPQSPNTAAPGGGTQYPSIAPTIVNMSTAQDITASPNGWINDCPAGGCTANETQTLGNNALVCMDANGTANTCDTAAATVLDGNGRPTGNADGSGRNRDFLGTTPRDFQSTYLPPPQGGNPESGTSATGTGAAQIVFRRGMVTHLFYLTNWYHDQLYRLGFDEGAANFQQTNFSGMGTGGDRVLGDAQDNTGVDNANFATPPDGMSGRMQMYRFTGPTIDRDGSLDAEIVLHELTHGTSNRLIGNGTGLNYDVGAGMGEGWSDFYALSLLNNTNADNPNAKYASGGYALYKAFGVTTYLDNYVYGIRRFPYSTVNTVNPMTWADDDDVTNNLSGGITPDPLGFNFNGGMEVHNIGEIWANTLWEVRSRVIADPAGANGDVPTGSRKMLQITTDAMKMTPIDPTFTEARDALINADCAANACANEQAIWDGFADRGLGYKASAPLAYVINPIYSTHMGIQESFKAPYLDVANPATDLTFTEYPGNSNGAIDPGEGINLSVKLTNPWRNAAKSVPSATATLTSSTPGVKIITGNSTYSAIPANLSLKPDGSSTGTPFTFTVSPTATCGQSLNFTIHTTSALGTSDVDFTLRVGLPSGTDAPVTYTDTIAGGLAIPDASPRGIIRPLVITDDFQIADLNFRIDSLNHTWDGDVTAELRSPDGYGTDFVGLIGFLAADAGNGDNLTNMVIDDEAPSANNMASAPNTSAPFTGNWLPSFNTMTTDETVPQLSRFDGKSTKGTWNIVVSDLATGDTGTLNGWSMIVTPVHFACTVLAPTAAGANVNGRVLDAKGKGISGAKVVLTDENGKGRTATTNSFGNYAFSDIPTGQTIVLKPTAKGLTFAPQVLSFNNAVDNLNFYPQ